jgi:hypothetical protein
MHARTHARMHARTHTHTHTCLRSVIQVRMQATETPVTFEIARMKKKQLSVSNAIRHVIWRGVSYTADSTAVSAIV